MIKLILPYTVMERSSLRCYGPGTRNSFRQLENPDSEPNLQSVNFGSHIEAVLGVSKASGNLQALVKYRGQKKAALVDVAEVREKYPELLIKYYESICRWC